MTEEVRIFQFSLPEIHPDKVFFYKASTGEYAFNSLFLRFKLYHALGRFGALGLSILSS